MDCYKDLGGDSGIVAYETAQSEITVKFSDGYHYLYSTESTSLSNIQEMKRLADQGVGLNSFIQRVVKKEFVRKWR